MKDQLKEYIESAFSKAAKTKKNQELKEEVLSNLYEKYDDLIASGVSKEEAYRLTTESIGDLSSLFEHAENEENPQNENHARSSSQQRKFVPLYHESEAEKKKTIHDVGLACAIMLYIFSLFPVIIWNEHLFSVIGMFLMIALATGTIIYLSCTKPILVSAELNEAQLIATRKKRKISAWMLSGSVMLYILCVCPVILFPDGKFGILAMFTMIALATGMIIIRGTTMTIQEQTKDIPKLSETNHIPQTQQKKTVSQTIFSILSGLYWASVVLIYFVYSFISGQWGVSWLIFIYGALLYIIAHGVYSLVIGRHRAGSVIKIIIASILLFSVLTPTLVANQFDLKFSLGSSNLLYDDRHYQSGNIQIEDTGIDTLDIEWIDGEVYIKYWDENYISVYEESNESLSESDKMHYYHSGKNLSIKFKSSHFVLFGQLPAKTLTVCLPREAELNHLSISGVNTNLYVEGLNATTVHLANVSGTIRASDCTLRDIDLESVSGNIYLSGNAVEIAIDTVSGDTEMILSNSPESIEIDGVSADATLIFPTDLIGFSVEFDSVSGKLKLPDNYHYDDDEYVYGKDHTEIQYDSVSGNLTIKLQ